MAIAFLCKRGVRIFHYLDDVGTVHRSSREAPGPSLADLDGIRLDDQLPKMPPHTTQNITYLGMIFDTGQYKIFVPEDKISHVCAEVMSSAVITVRGAMSFLGLLTACIPAVAWAQWHTRRFKFCLLDQWHRSSLNQKFQVPRFISNSLLWWTRGSNLFGQAHQSWRLDHDYLGRQFTGLGGLTV